MSYYIRIDEDSAEKLAHGVILESIKTLEAVGSFEDVPIWDALNEVLAYYSTPAQLEELENRGISTEWMEIVLEHDQWQNSTH